MSLPALTGCIQSAGSPAPPSASAAPTLPTAHWEQPSASIVSQWDYDAGLNFPSKPMHTQNSIDGSPITDTEFRLAFTIDDGLYSAGNEILEFRVDFEPSDNAVAREGAGIGTGALPEFNVNGQGATTSLRLVTEGVTPTLNLPASSRGITTFDMLSIADTQYGGATTISFTNSTMLSSFKILVYLQIMGDNGVAGTTLTHTFNPPDEWPDDAYIIGPTTHIPQVTMKLNDWTSQLQGVDPSLTEYTGIFNWAAGTASVPIQRAPVDGDVRHKHNYVPPGGVGNPCESLMGGYNLALGWDFGTASDSTHYATIPAIKPDGDGNLNSIEELKITINHTSDPAETHNLPKWGNAWGEEDPDYLVFNAFEMTGETYEAPFNYMVANNTTSVPIASQAYLHELVGINQDAGILNFNGPLNSSSNTATFTFTGWLVDAYNQTVQLASMGTPIQLSATFIAEPGC